MSRSEARSRTPASPSSGHVADIAYVALGSNLGDRRGYLASALAALSLLPESTLLASSQVEETIPLGAAAQGPYLNQMVALRTALSPDALLENLQRIERSLGRVRTARWAARTIDLDIVRVGDVRLEDARLTIPHPGLIDRTFWKTELAELEMLLDGVA